MKWYESWSEIYGGVRVPHLVLFSISEVLD